MKESRVNNMMGMYRSGALPRGGLLLLACEEVDRLERVVEAQRKEMEALKCRSLWAVLRDWWRG